MDGAQGPPGSPGLNSIDPTNLYRVLGFFNGTNQFGGTATSTATCNPGDTVYLGSYLLFNVGIIDSVSDFASSGFNGWQATITEDDPVNEAQVRAFATCFDNPP